MIKLKDFLQLFNSENMYVDLYIDGRPSLYATLEDAIKILGFDSRGELLITEQSVSIHEVYLGFAGKYSKSLEIHCKSKWNKKRVLYAR